MIDGQSNISKIFGSRRLKAISDIRTFFQTNEQPVAFVARQRSTGSADR